MADETADLLSRVRELANYHYEWFDDSFVGSLESQFDNKGYLTKKQIVALENIEMMLEERR